MTQWTPDDPGAGDADALRTQAARLDTLARQLAEACSSVRRYRELLGPDVWTGTAAEAFRVGSATHLANLTRLVETVAPCATALHVYAGAVQRIADDAAAARGRHTEAASEHARALRLLSQYDAAPAGTVSDVSMGAQRTARDDAVRRMSHAGHELQALADERASADARVLLDLHAVTAIADWSALGADLAAAGLHRPGDLSTSGLRDALLRLARDILGGDTSAATLAALQNLLDAHADDPTLLSTFFARLGGAGTADLVSRVGARVLDRRVDHETGLRLAVTLQSALSAASTLWTPARARAFARDLAGASDGAAVVGFLFGNPWTAPMGEHLTVAMADLIDQRERLGTGPWASGLAGGALALANLQFPDRAGRAADPAGAVLQTLGQYPDAALAWLTAGGPVPGAGRADAFPRIAHWAGARVWPEADGYTAVTALWSGMQLATGGPNDPAGWDQGAWTALAEANSAFIAAFLGNPHVLPEHLDEEARINLVTAITRQLPLLREVPLVRDSENSSDLTVPGYMVEYGSDVILTNTTRAELAALFGLAGSSAAGAEALRDSVSLLQSAMLGAAADRTGYSPETALAAVSDLQAILDGALEGAARGIAVRHDARVQSLIDTAVTAAGFVPLPGSGKAAETLARGASAVLRESLATQAGEAVVDLARDGLVDALASGASNAWASTLGDPTADPDEAKESLSAALRPWVTALQPGALKHQGDNVSYYVGELLKGYESARDAARDAAGMTS
ncbi:hypothetical protein [Cellulomonas sp. IC4_254]|uniref:hypothetical protein n=1 Tax=Cellulomonas sp. IC4_254 TaxID=2714040 RepID=UPI001423A4E1|nr:hypothetical protein [Cellulomonas sp. IC4_254]NHT18837.1 hypothetical protein [Cellulomonas sp. IC4_254]